MKLNAWLGFSVLLLLALGLRLFNIEASSLWLDEIYSFMTANVHLRPEVLEPAVHPARYYYEQYLAWQPMDIDALMALLKINVHMPLYYLLLNPWLGVVGNDAFGLRSFSALFSTLMLVPVYGLACAIGDRRLGFFALFAGAVLPFQLYFAQEGRMYTLAMFWACMAALTFWKTMYAEKPLKWSLLYAASVALGMLSHYMFVFFLGFNVVYAIFWLARTRNLKRFLLFGFALAALVGVAIGWIPMYQAQHQGVQEDYHFAKGLVNGMRYVTALVWQPLVMVAGDNKLLRVIYIPLTILMLLVAFLRFGDSRHSRKLDMRPLALNRELFLLAWLWVPMLLQIAYDLMNGTHTVVIDRYVLLSSPAMILLLSLGLERLSVTSKRSVGIVLGLMLVLAIGNVWSPSPFRDEHNKKDIRDDIAYLVQHGKPGDLIFANGAFGVQNLAAYYLVRENPDQPLLFWMSPYNGQPVPLPEAFVLQPYRRIWMFRYRANNERGLQKAKDYLEMMYREAGTPHDWILYSRAI